MRRYWPLVAILCAILFGALTAPDLRQGYRLPTTAAGEQALLSHHPEWRGLAILRTNIYDHGKDTIDSILIRDGERVVYTGGQDGNDTKPKAIAIGLAVGNILFYKPWGLLLLILPALLLAFFVPAFRLPGVVSAWGACWLLLSAHHYVRITQLWATVGLLLGIGYGVFKLWKTRAETATKLSHQWSLPLIEAEKRSWWVLATLFSALCGSALIFFKTEPIDVALATLEGAQQFLSGHIIYGQQHPIIPFSDTYPPLMYALYLPSFLFGPQIVNVFYEPIGLIIWNYVLYITGCVLAWRRAPQLGLLWACAVPIILVASAGSNDLLLSLLLFCAVLGHRWAYALAAAVKLIPLAWIGPELRLHWKSTFSWLIGFGALSLAIVILFGGTDGIGKAIHAIGFQADRQSWNDMAVLFDWPWWHPLTRGLLAGLALASLFWARAANAPWWMWTLGCTVALGAQYTNPLYVSWLWVLAVGAGLTQLRTATEEEKTA
jgi:hypothetical protein